MGYLNFKARFHRQHPINVVNLRMHIIKTEENFYEFHRRPSTKVDVPSRSWSIMSTTVFCSLWVIDVAICGTPMVRNPEEWHLHQRVHVPICQVIIKIKRRLHQVQPWQYHLLYFLFFFRSHCVKMLMNSSNSSNHSVFSVSNARQRPPFIAIQYLVAWCLVYLTIAIFAILGNFLIILVFVKKRSLKTRTNYFVIGLAIGDVLVGASTIPLYVTLLVLLFKKDYKEAALVQTIFSPMDVLSGMLSILHLTTISVERVYAIAFPLRHRTSSSRFSLIILPFIWLTAAGIASLNFIIPKGPQWKGTFLIYSALGFFVPFSIILVAYTSIWIIVKNKTKISRTRARVMKRESRTAFTIFTLILLFLLTWLPFFSLNLVLFSCTKCAAAVSLQMVLFFKALHYSGSALNPVVYSARMPEFRRPVLTLLKERRLAGSLYRHSTGQQSFKSTIRRRNVELSDVCDQQRTNSVNDTDASLAVDKDTEQLHLQD